jgi:hypothetical protein
MSLSRKLIAGFTGVALLGCGNLADEESSPPALATITGTLSLAEDVEVPDEQIRMALVWRTRESVNVSDDPEWDSNGECGLSDRFLDYATQQIALSATFPSQFTLNLTQPPPMEAILLREEGGEPIGAEATIYVYADRNGNGQLDSKPYGGESPDLVLATSFPDPWRTAVGDEPLGHEVTYFTEPYTDGTWSAEAGYSLTSYGLSGGSSAPIDTPIELELTGAPHLQDFLCESRCEVNADMPAPCPTTLDQLPEPPAEAIAFLSYADRNQPGWGWGDGTGGHVTEMRSCSEGVLFWTQRACSGCKCATATCIYTELTAGSADWPCD